MKKKAAARAARPPRLAIVRADKSKSAGGVAVWDDFYRKLAAEVERLESAIVSATAL